MLAQLMELAVGVMDLEGERAGKGIFGTCAGIGREKRVARKKKWTKTDVRASSWRSEEIKKENLCLILSNEALSNVAPPRIMSSYPVFASLSLEISLRPFWGGNSQDLKSQ